MNQITSAEDLLSSLTPCSSPVHEARTRRWSIGQLATATGETVKTLRYWTDFGPLPSQRDQNRYRSYDPSLKTRVPTIRRAQAMGFTLEEIQDLLRACGEDAHDCGLVRDQIALGLERVRAKMSALRAFEVELTERLEWADAHPEPNCSVARVCDYLVSDASIESSGLDSPLYGRP